MKFKTYLENIAGIDVYPLISLLLFVCFFVIVTIWVMMTNKNKIQYYKNIPFDNKKNPSGYEK